MTGHWIKDTADDTATRVGLNRDLVGIIAAAF